MSVVAGAANVAEAETVDLGTVVPGQVYEYPALSTVIGQYTPSQTGPVKFMFSRAGLDLYTSPSYDEESLVGYQFSYVEGQQMRSFSQLEAGTTYYLMGFPMDNSTMEIIEGKSDLEVVRVNPTLNEGDYFSVSSNYTIDVAFNMPVQLTNALILIGNERSTVSYTASNSYVTLDVAAPIMKMYREGKIKKGDVMTVRLVSVADAFDSTNKYGSTGKFETEFLMPDKPAELLNIVNASLSNTDNPFNSYYATNDPAGTISFEFDAPLAADAPVAKLTYGNTDEMEIGVYVEEVPGVIDGNTASFDFSGKLRRPIDMLPTSTAATQPSNFAILFSNIFTEDGQRVYTARQANPSGFPLSFKINTLQYTISTDFTPGRGSKLVPGKEMEIWVMNGMYLNSTGIRFDYTEGGQPNSYVIPMSEVVVEPDPIAEEDMIYTFKIPAINVDEGTNVTVTFADAECADGLDHGKDLTAQFSYDSSTVGVESVGNDGSDSVTVYNVAGVCVMKNADRAALKSLPKGLYIVNGKKEIVR